MKDMNYTEMEFTHFDDAKNAQMVDVSQKDITYRMAIAQGMITLGKEAFDAVLGKKIKKGDVLTVAQVAGIMGTKQTANLIPMCHMLNLSNAKVEFELFPTTFQIKAVCTVRTEGKTGVEMEALTGVSISLLTIYDMCKAISKDMQISDIYLIKKSGGKSGEYVYHG